MGMGGSRKIGKMRSLAIVLLSAVALSRANPCQNDQDVYFPDREDCGRFYMCRNGDVVGHMNCPDGLLWNTDLLTCDWPRNVECTPGCPEGWSSVGDSCYFLSRERVGKFSAAQEFCSNMGARLVEINSAEENEAIVGLAEAARSGKNDGLDYWLGGFELAEVSEVSSEESDEEDEEGEGGEEEDEDGVHKLVGRGPGRLRDGQVEGRLHPAVEEGRHQPRQLGLLLLGQGGHQRQVHQQRWRQRSYLRDVNEEQNFVDYVFFFKILKICCNKSRINYSKNKN